MTRRAFILAPAALISAQSHAAEPWFDRIERLHRRFAVRFNQWSDWAGELAGQKSPFSPDFAPSVAQRWIELDVAGHFRRLHQAMTGAEDPLERI